MPFLYLAPFEDDLPCNFSKVSRICFWTSTSEGSLATGLDLPPGLLKVLLLLLETVGFTGSLEILILFLLETELCFEAADLGLSNLPKSILSPTVFKTLNLVYLVLILELSLTSSTWDSDFIFSTVKTGFITFFSAFDSTLGSVLGSVLGSILSSVLGLALGLLNLSKSIFPKWTGFLISALSIKEFLFFSFSSNSFSSLILSSSFSFLFSSLKSWDSTLLDLSELNSFKNKVYWSGEILVVGLASISCPLEARNSTALSREMLNSLKILFNLFSFSG